MATTLTTAQIAAIVRALPDTALCALVDCARWADSEGTITELVQTDEDYLAIGEALAQIEDGIAP